jgi:hypothetical protein
MARAWYFTAYPKVCPLLTMLPFESCPISPWQMVKSVCAMSICLSTRICAGG